MQFHYTHLLINTHTKLLRKNMVRHRKPLQVKMKEQKPDDSRHGPSHQIKKKHG